MANVVASTTNGKERGEGGEKGGRKEGRKKETETERYEDNNTGEG